MAGEDSDRRIELARAIQNGIDAALVDLHVCLPGQIVSFDSSTQLADIQLTIKAKHNGKVINRALLKEVPVRFLKNKNYVITLPIEVGDEVSVFCAERSIDTWLLNGGIQDPADNRKHSFSDAFAVPVLYSQKSVIPDFDASNLQIKAINGNSKITVKSSGEIDFETTGQTNITSSKTVINNDVDIKGNLTVDETALVKGAITGQTGMAVTGTHPSTGKAGSFTGELYITSGDVKADGIGLKTHTHTQGNDSGGDSQQTTSVGSG